MKSSIFTAKRNFSENFERLFLDAFTTNGVYVGVETDKKLNDSYAPHTDEYFARMILDKIRMASRFDVFFTFKDDILFGREFSRNIVNTKPHAQNISLFNLVDTFSGRDLPTPILRSAYASLPHEAICDVELIIKKLAPVAEAFEQAVPVIKKLKADIVGKEAKVIASVLKPKFEKTIKRNLTLTTDQSNVIEYLRGYAHWTPLYENSFALLSVLAETSCDILVDEKIECMTQARSDIKDNADLKVNKDLHKVGNNKNNKTQNVKEPTANFTARSNRHMAMKRLVAKATKYSENSVAYTLGRMNVVSLPSKVREALCVRFTETPSNNHLIKLHKNLGFMPLDARTIENLLFKYKKCLENNLVVEVRRRCSKVNHLGQPVIVNLKLNDDEIATNKIG
jgi:hypothetical protein